MEKKFKLGFTIGRFQFFHKGHESLIDTGLDLCEKFVILIGSSDKSRIMNNPFTFEERKEMIETRYCCYSDRLFILPVFDLGIGYVPQWGGYLLKTIEFNVGRTPDFYIGGVESGRENWLIGEDITRVLVSRDLCPISATKCRRELAIANDKELEESKRRKSRYFIWQNGFYSVEQLKRWRQIIKDSGGY